MHTSDVYCAEAVEFSELQLSDAVLRGLAEAGFERPSPIQAKAIPLGRFGVDLIAQAKSGTGKTIVFAAIALEAIQRDGGGPQALIVAPTREVAIQSRDVCRLIGSHLRHLNCHAFVGGTPIRGDMALAGSCQLACGTPGRLVGLLLSEALLASRVRLLVLDEADKLLESGFESQLRYLLTALPERKQTLAFSATYPDELLEALRASMRSPLTLSLLPPPDAATRGADGAHGDADDDDDDPLGLLERPYTLGSGAAGAAGSEAASGAATAAAGDDSAAFPGGGSGVSADRAGRMVSEAALVGVRQFYSVVERDGATAGGGEAEAKRVEVLRLLDEISFHQALVFCNQHEQVTACNSLEQQVTACSGR